MASLRGDFDDYLPWSVWNWTAVVLLTLLVVAWLMFAQRPLNVVNDSGGSFPQSADVSP